jgi:hypothetical protein
MLVLASLMASVAGRVRIGRSAAGSADAPAGCQATDAGAQPLRQAATPRLGLTAQSDPRTALVDAHVAQIVAELIRSHPDPSRAVWDQGLEMVRGSLPDVTDAEWRAACNRNYWPLHQTAVEAQAAEAAMQPRHATT